MHQPAERERLGAKPPLLALTLAARAQHLDRNRSRRLELLRRVHRADAAATDHALEDASADGLAYDGLARERILLAALGALDGLARFGVGELGEEFAQFGLGFGAGLRERREEGIAIRRIDRQHLVKQVCEIRKVGREMRGRQRRGTTTNVSC